MPIYEYRCHQCGLEFELLQKFSDEPPRACGECGGAVEKLISLSAFQLKGSGWYVTDYARKSAQGVEDKDSKPKAAESAKPAAAAASTSETAKPSSSS